MDQEELEQDLSASKQKELDDKFQEMMTMAESHKPKEETKKSPSNETEPEDDVIFKVEPGKAKEPINDIILLSKNFTCFP